MECLPIVLFILVVFAIFICLENNGYFKTKEPFVVEGIDNQDILNASVGLCYDPEREPPDNIIFPQDQQSCTGITGFSFEYITLDEKINDLTSINTPAEDLERELSLEYGDVIEATVDGEKKEFIYRGLEPIDLRNRNEDDKIAFFPYKNPENDDIEYCYTITGENIGQDNSTTKATCEENSNNVWLRPVYEPDNLRILDMDSSLTNEACVNESEHESINCLNLSQIELNSCYIIDTENNKTIRPTAFWKPTYNRREEDVGSGNLPDNILNQTVRETCVGVPTGHIWDFTSISEITNNNQIIAAQISQQLEGTEEINTQLRDNQMSTRQLTESGSSLVAAEEEYRIRRQQQECGYENGNEKLYHGNFDQNTANLYQCNTDVLSAGNVRVQMSQTCPREQLMCDTNFASEESGRTIQTQCDSSDVITYYGCQPNRCKLPDNFSTKYRFKNGVSPPNNVNDISINDVKDMRYNSDEYSSMTDEERQALLKIECNNGYHGNITVSSCPPDQDDIRQDMVINGCQPNVCSLPNNLTSYDLSTTPSGTFSLDAENDDNSFHVRFGIHTNIDPLESPSQNFSCSFPNYHYIYNSNQYERFRQDVSNPELNVHQYVNFPSVTCPINNEDFVFGGECQPNLCKNPSLSNKVFAGGIDEPPSDINDLIDIYPENTNPYAIYEYKNLSQDPNNLIYNSIENKIKCGNSYHKESVTGATLDLNDIKCFNFYNYSRNSTDNDAPIYSTGPDGTTITEYNDFLDNYNTFTEDQRVFNFSVQGCEPNLCSWPTSQPSFDKPRERDSDITFTDGSSKTDRSRYQLGYKLDGENITYSDAQKNVRSWVDYEENNESRLQCQSSYEEGETQRCYEEPTFTNEEINTMLSSQDENINQSLQILKNKGQFNLPNNEQNYSSYLESVNRGGEFQIRRCWHNNVTDIDPTLSCSTNDSNLQLNGCSQNKCRLNPEHASNGTRLIVQMSDTEYYSVGGGSEIPGHIVDSENMELQFNVDQIRNISCDYNHSKDTEMDPTTIECLEDGEYFTINNACSKTTCAQPPNINGLINLTNNNGDVNSICSTKTWVDSHDYNSGESSPLTLNDVVPITTLPSECKNDPDDSILDYNRGRYSGSDWTYTCDIPSTISDPNISSIGIPHVECNYQPGETEAVKTLSGCQPKLCRLPDIIPEGIDPDPLISPGGVYSIEYLKGRTTTNVNIIGERTNPQFLSGDGEYDKINKNDLIKCNPSTHTGEVTLECPQDSPGEIPQMIISGCEPNRCSISDYDAFSSSYDFIQEHPTDLDTLDQTGTTVTRDMLIQNIVCKDNHIQSPTSENDFTCGEEGVFQNTDNICNETQCSNVHNITESDSYIDGTSGDTYQQKRNRLSSLPETFDGDQIETIPELLESERNIIIDNQNYYNYFKTIGSPDQTHHCYIGTDSQGLHEIECSGQNQCTVSDLEGLRCSTVCDGSPEMSCSGTGQPLDITGCSENYCSLPSIDNTLLYDMGNDRDKLDKLAELQGGKLTKNQIKNTLTQPGSYFKCASYSVNESNETGGSVNIDTNIMCNSHNGVFEITGCSQPSLPGENHTTGHIQYHFYPTDCGGIQNRPFIYLSGTDPFGRDQENSFGSSVSHTLDRSALLDNIILEDAQPHQYYYYKPTSGSSVNDIQFDYITGEDGFARENSDVEFTGWIKQQYYLNYSNIQSQEVINTLTKTFMDTSKDMCDKLDTCGGFSVTQFNRLTSEIDAIEKSGARNEDGTITKATLQGQLADINIIEYGTLKSEHKPEDCLLPSPVIGDSQGDKTIFGHNVYNHTENEDIFNYRVIQPNVPVYFHQVRIDDPDMDNIGAGILGTIEESP